MWARDSDRAGEKDGRREKEREKRGRERAREIERDKYPFDKSLVSLDLGSNPRSPARDTSALLIRPLRPVPHS